jgi:predicted RNA-binding Zn-ribbon protein involved in translation (DUF1610 family)
MTTIRTTCPRCGEVDMGPEAILLSVLQGGREGTYRFTCPTCMDAVEKRADRKIVALLVSAGVDVMSGEATEERMDTALWDDDDAADQRPALRSTGPAFTANDVIDFHFMLEDDDYVRRFFASQT